MMLKRVLIAVGAVFALIVVWGLIQLLIGGDSSSQQKMQKQPQADQTEWDGQGTRVYNTSIAQRGGEQLLVDSMDFQNLNLQTSTVTAHLVTPLPVPSWFNAKNFIAVQPGQNKIYKPTFSPIDGQFGATDGDQQVVNVTWKDLPTNALGPTCQNPAADPVNPIFMQINNLPIKTLRVAITAPKLQTNQCLIDQKAVQLDNRKKAIMANGATITKVSSNGKTITVNGTLNTTGLTSATLQSGADGNFRKIKPIPVNQKSWVIQFQAIGRNKQVLRVQVVDPATGISYPKAAIRGYAWAAKK